MSVMALGKRIRQLRRAVGLSQSELAARVGVHASYIGHLETGRIKLPSENILTRLARALGTDSEDLLAAAGYLTAPAKSAPLDLADPSLKIYLAALGELPQEDQQVLSQIIQAFLARNRRRRDLGGE